MRMANKLGEIKLDGHAFHVGEAKKQFDTQVLPAQVELEQGSRRSRKRDTGSQMTKPPQRR
jgi:hypothetical protein